MRTRDVSSKLSIREPAFTEGSDVIEKETEKERRDVAFARSKIERKRIGERGKLNEGAFVVVAFEKSAEGPKRDQRYSGAKRVEKANEQTPEESHR